MGDFCVPKRREVFDKIRRRLEHYRHHQSEAASRFLEASPSIYEQHKQDTLLLRQRWLESKAKKAAKQPKGRDSNSLQSDHRNLVVTKLKRKIDSVNAEANSSTSGPSTTTKTAAETVFNFDDNDLETCNIKNSKTSNNKSATYGGNKHNSGLPSLSVQIVQQISAHSQQDTPQTIHTNVTVSSCYGTDSPKSGSHSVHTSVQCKQEPSEENSRSSAANASSLSNADTSDLDSAFESDIGIGIDDVDELQNFLDSIEKNEPSLLNELSKFDEICEQYHHDSESNESGNMFNSLACASPGLSKGSYPSLGSCGHMGGMFDNNQNMNSASNHAIPAAIPEPTGPAAETLKQMAAQHQHQHSPGYPIKNMDHYTDTLHSRSFSPNYSQMYRQVPSMASSFPYNHSTNHHLSDSSQLTPEMAAAMTYGGTKPLTHFPNEQGQQHNSSSLQQLQNQVQSHFKPSMGAPHQMQITQTQHMQLTHGSHSIQMTQTQQAPMQQQPQQQISMSQQQSFSMSQQQIVSDQMKMQMMEKMRMEQQQQQQQQKQQQQQQHQQHQQQQQQQHAQQGRMPPQYMGRPPPDYNMHHSSRPPVPYTNSMNPNGNQNLLQTMQNMVNQTSAYGAVKSEVATSCSPAQTNNGMMTSQISAMQQQTMSASISSTGNHTQSSRSDFHSQLQQPPGYSSVDTSDHAQSSATYTSAIMRNQRPPNVNVGPEGLNISQSRTNTDGARTNTDGARTNTDWARTNTDWARTNTDGARTNTDWARTNMLQSSHLPMRSGISNNGPSSHSMSQSASMSAHMMQYQQERSSHYGAGANAGGMTGTTANMAQAQNQARPGHLRTVPGSGMVPASSHMMMQHQGIQMSQQMNMHASNSAYNMGGSASGTGSVLSAGGYSMAAPSSLHSDPASNSQTNAAQPASFSSHPSATMSNQDEFLHFLDNPLSNGPMFDSMHPSTAEDFSLFDDILNGK